LRSSPGATAGSAGETEERLSGIWKGWTNGGGERVSTAAQFTRLGEHSPAAHAPYFSAPGFGAVRNPFGPVVTAPSAEPRLFPVHDADLMAPVGTAIERLVARGHDRLSVTVRFEQGGTLSLKLGMRDGEITSQIRTDVPGLESALRSAWTQFAHDWQGRGLKLATPSFSAEADSHPMSGRGREQDTPEHQRDAGSFQAQTASFTASHGSRVRGALHGAAPAGTTTADTGANSGLRTWA
jgi:hypothetical protein